MKFLPKSRSEIIRLAISVVVLAIVTFAFRPEQVVGYLGSDKREGDIFSNPFLAVR